MLQLPRGARASTSPCFKVTAAALTRTFSRATRMASRSKSQASTRAAPSFAAAIARMPLPVPRSSKLQSRPCNALLASQSRRRQEAVVACSPVPKAIPAGMTIAEGNTRNAFVESTTVSLRRMRIGFLAAGTARAFPSTMLPPKPAFNSAASFPERANASNRIALPFGKLVIASRVPRKARLSIHASSLFAGASFRQAGKRLRRSRLGRFAKFRLHHAHLAQRHLRLAHENRAILYRQPRRFQVADQLGPRLQLAPLLRGDVAADLACYARRLRPDLPADAAGLPDEQRALRENFPLHFSVDGQFTAELDRSFYFHVAAKSVLCRRHNSFCNCHFFVRPRRGGPIHTSYLFLRNGKKRRNSPAAPVFHL